MAIQSLVRLVAESKAVLAGIGCVIEKPAENGREVIGELGVPVLALAKVEFNDDAMQVS